MSCDVDCQSTDFSSMFNIQDKREYSSQSSREYNNSMSDELGPCSESDSADSSFGEREDWSRLTNFRKKDLIFFQQMNETCMKAPRTFYYMKGPSPI